ncbi:TPA: hypothetical protein U1383_002146 [Streptococcus suis]|uniref:hypothetical protein n=1 Tax=Streptococcus suis TaxID=1307 RepID=UPI000CF3E8D2|nr:hypothetical protein [Streptococcus suis]HEM5311370.1 hypothetical protein [Streptococcus suis]
MAYKDYNKLSSRVDELVELDNKIKEKKSQLATIKRLSEYNLLAEEINVLVKEFNEMRRGIKDEV